MATTPNGMTTGGGEVQELEDEADEVERLKRWNMDAGLARDAFQRENAALRSKLERAHFMMCAASADIQDREVARAHDTLQRAIRALA